MGGVGKGRLTMKFGKEYRIWCRCTKTRQDTWKENEYTFLAFCISS